MQQKTLHKKIFKSRTRKGEQIMVLQNFTYKEAGNDELTFIIENYRKKNHFSQLVRESMMFYFSFKEKVTSKYSDRTYLKAYKERSSLELLEQFQPELYIDEVKKTGPLVTNTFSYDENDKEFSALIKSLKKKRQLSKYVVRSIFLYLGLPDEVRELLDKDQVRKAFVFEKGVELLQLNTNNFNFNELSFDGTQIE